ncbi:MULTISPECIES: PP2C family protein-serine/threonine phosphatase [unclassified Treponema]|uniref:PP2C family protein-serine/threonine phosphatase n=1 Tax=unclassified Treponema TaxID=2638727 RepID=UPI0005300EE1|nr:MULTISPECIES: PP2C family protein-serine/threonine phosphatase [unclassified Treponema]AIW90550.1 siderophore-interacting protein [Treponema sp. OMZ 838]UTC43952.1 SpoIIE family protein phosphatase [Treponema sp. OMZ 857]UTC51627.1 SpoIIE family protein phosphatase [Treponema sp. OMZ 855]
MGLIFFTYFGAVLLLVNSSYLSFHQSNRINVLLNKITVPAAAFALCIAASVHLVFYGQAGIQRVVTMCGIFFMLLASYHILDMVLVISNFKIYKVLQKINTVFHIAGIGLIIFFVGRFQWNPLRGFYFSQRDVVPGLAGIKLFMYIYIFFVPVLSITICFVKMFFVKSNIHRQQLLLHGFSIGLALAIWITESYFFQVFSWAFAFIPFGYAAMLMLDNAVFSLTRAFDIKQIFFGFLRFILFTAIFAGAAGLTTALIMQFIPSVGGWMSSITVSCIILFFIRSFVARKLRYALGRTADYEVRLDAELQKLDFGKGHDTVLETFPRIMKQYITCKGLDILVSDENMNLQTVYSDFDHHNTLSANLACFEYLLSQNNIVLTKTELIANYVYESIRDELLDIFETTQTEILISMREGQKLIGCILLAPKTHSAEYNLYDIRVLSNMYSYFFLVIYYLRNISKQDITVTIDREVEMSDQIIGSIQNYKDTLESHGFSMDSIAYSAHQLGGDFIDYITLNEKRAMFLIGDVSGKGLSASMSMVILKSIIHTYLQTISDFKELVTKVNRFIKDNLPRGTFFAGLFGIIDFPTNTIYYLNCGIPLMSMYISSYKNAIEIQGEGRVLGFVKNIEPFLKVRKITMHKGDAIVFTTDGLLEATNLKGDRFGSDRVGRILQENNGAKPSQIARTIYNNLLDFILRKIDDDVTILVLKYNQ